MTNVEKNCEISAAVRGYHYYGKTWFPQEGEVLQCLHEFGNVFDVFAIKTCKPDGTIVGHLPREISRATKFLLDRGATISANLILTDYRRSPLVQGGLEIACKVSVKLPGSIRNQLLIDRYLELVKTLYTEPKNEVILGSFRSEQSLQIPRKQGKQRSNQKKKKQKADQDIPEQSLQIPRKQGKQRSNQKKKKQKADQDIRVMFLQAAKRQKEKEDFICIE